MTTQTKEAIHGKIARVLNSHEVALNIGSAQGVEVNMLFDILTPRAHEIKDPDTGEVLGMLERSKMRVRVVRVLDKISVAATFGNVEVNVGGGRGEAVRRYLYGKDRLLKPPNWVIQRETIKTTEPTWDELSDEERHISTGDPVVQVFYDDDLNTF